MCGRLWIVLRNQMGTIPLWRTIAVINSSMKLVELKLPTLKIGDEMMVGKFKNRTAIITGFATDKHGQPIAKTDKGDQQIFKGRIKKLMDKK